MGAEVVYALQLLRWHACFSVVVFPMFSRWGFMIEAQVRIGQVAHGDDQCVMNGLGAPAVRFPLLKLGSLSLILVMINALGNSVAYQLSIEKSFILLGKLLDVRRGAIFFPRLFISIEISTMNWMNEGRKQSHNSPTTAKSFLIFASSFAVFGLSLEMWIVDTSFLMRISFGHNKTVVVFAVTQLLSTKNQLLCVYSFYIAILFFYFVCVCAWKDKNQKWPQSFYT